MYKLLSILLFAVGLAVTTDNIYDNSWALIIGIDKYQNVPSLNYAVRDAESIQKILVDTFDFSARNITLLKNEHATKKNILQSFSDITMNAKEQDRVLIFFAGHGETMDLPDGGEMGYLLPVDGNTENLYLSSIGMDELKKISIMSNGKHLLYLIDACYGGIAAVGTRGLDAKSTANYIEKITRNKSRQIITAGGRGEQVIEKSEWGHSAFTKNLKQGLKDGNADLNGDTYITANELGLYLNEMVSIDSDNQQTPQVGRMTNQEGEFVFLLNSRSLKSTDEIKNAENSNAIDYDLLSSKIAEKLKGEKKEDGHEEKSPPVKRIKIFEPSSSSSKKKISWGIDLVLASQFPKDNTSGNVVSLIPKLIYKNNNIRLSIGYGFKALNAFHYRIYDTVGGVKRGNLNVKQLLQIGFKYNITKFDAFPLILNIDSYILNIPNGNHWYSHVTKGSEQYNYYSIGLGTQLMLVNSRFNIELGAFDIDNNLQNILDGGMYMDTGLISNIYIKIGYDMLPF